MDRCNDLADVVRRRDQEIRELKERAVRRSQQQPAARPVFQAMRSSSDQANLYRNLFPNHQPQRASDSRAEQQPQE